MEYILNKELFNHIKCPYCFKEFAHTDVLFRSMSAFEEHELDPHGMGVTMEEIEFSMPDGLEKIKRISEYQRRMKFQITEDRLYTSFWKSFGGTSETGAGVNEAIPDYLRPIISPQDKDAVPKGGAFDNDGFLYMIEDCFGKESYDRVCPRCHNPLPANYGKYPIEFVSVIGISSAGKTVFLSKLIENIGQYAAKLSMSALPATKRSREFVSENKITKNQSLPGGNPIQYMSQPLFYNLNFSAQGEDRECMFAIYDIAGESCVDASKIKNFGKFVMNSDGLIILIDPNQFKDLGGEAERLTDSVLATLKNIMNTGGKVQTPTAICISKSDMMKHIFPPVCFEDVKTVGQKQFCAADYNQISSFVHKFIEEHDNQINVTLKNIYDRYNYFAFTTLNCDVTTDENGRKFPEKEPDPKRIEEPLFWLFKEFGFISSEIPVADYSQFACEVANLRRRIAESERELRETPAWHLIVRQRITKEIESLNSRLAQLMTTRSS